MIIGLISFSKYKYCGVKRSFSASAMVLSIRSSVLFPLNPARLSLRIKYSTPSFRQISSQHDSLSVKDLKEIQAGPVVSIPTRSISFLFFGIKDASKFRQLFGSHILSNITSSEDARKIQSSVDKIKNNGEMATIAAINVAFSQTGLNQFFPNSDIKDASFQGGQRKKAQQLGDDEKNWLPNFKGSPIHGLFEVTGNPADHVEQVMQDKVKKALGDSITVIFEHTGVVREAQKGHEHFGFNDGISQPFVRFEDDSDKKRKPRPGQTTVDPGVLVLGRKGDPALAAKGRPEWAMLGSFVVYRHLQQKVPEFDKFLKDVVLKSIATHTPVPHGFTESDDFKNRVDFLGARLVGRWKSGLPVVKSLKEPGKFPVDDPVVGRDPEQNNNFDYGPRNSGDRKQDLCPFAAHTRKTGPRTDLPQDSIEKHAIQRAAIPFGPEVDEKEKAEMKTLKQRGLAFVCYQSSVADGFEFIQESWANNEKFPFGTGGVDPGFDPIIGQNHGGERKMTGADAENLAQVLKINQEFVVSQGGEYFFLPSLPTLNMIAQGALVKPKV